MNYNLSKIIGPVISSILYLCILPSSLLCNHKKIKISFSMIFVALIHSILLLAIDGLNMIVKTYIIILANFFIIKKFYEGNSVISMIISVIDYSIVFVFKQISIIFFSQLHDVNIMYIDYYPTITIQIELIVLCLVLLLSIFIRPIKLITQIKEFSFEKKSMVLVFLYIFISLAFLSMICSLIDTETFLGSVYNMAVCMLATYIIIYVIYILQIRVLIKSKNDYNSINSYIENVEKTATQIRKQEHEHNNELIAIKSLAEEHKTDEIVEFIEKIFQNKKENQIISNINLDNIKDKILKTLLIHKINSAIGLGIRIEVLVREKVENIIVSPKELTNIIGIIMDNAIEGAVNSDKKYISIMIDKDIDFDEVNIIISNSYNEIPQIYEDGVSSKGKMRGNGLSILNDIEENNSNIQINTEMTEELFIQDIYIKN